MARPAFRASRTTRTTSSTDRGRSTAATRVALSCEWMSFTSIGPARSEEHTSELQSRPHLVCRLLLEKKNQNAAQSGSAMCPRSSIDSPRIFFFNDTATTEIYTLSLHDALPISTSIGPAPASVWKIRYCSTGSGAPPVVSTRSEEHTSELQSRPHLVCRLLL